MGKQFTITYLDTENRTFEICVSAENEEDAIELAINEANEAYHGLKQILSVF